LQYWDSNEVLGSPARLATLEEAVLRGGYLPLFDKDRQLDSDRWLEDYLAALVNRDIYGILPVRNRTAFDRFIRLCSARTGQIFEAASLARELGVDNKTVKLWVSVLEQCFIVRLLQIRDINQLRLHPLWGALVGTWCFTEVLKARLNCGLGPDCWFWRTSDGKEVALLIETGEILHPVEIKSFATPDPRLAQGIGALRSLAEMRGKATTRVVPGFVVSRGDTQRPCREGRFISWHAIAAAMEDIP